MEFVLSFYGTLPQVLYLCHCWYCYWMCHRMDKCWGCYSECFMPCLLIHWKLINDYCVCGFTTSHNTADEETALVNLQSINGIVGGLLTVNPLSIPRTA